jgi:hypothetical protein
MPRKSIGDRAMSDAERQARCRAARAAGRPAIRIKRPADHRSRPSVTIPTADAVGTLSNSARRWLDTVTELAVLQAEYEAWL